MKASKLKVQDQKSTWPYWLLRYVATNTQQSFEEMARWIDEQIAEQLARKESQDGKTELIALTKLLSDYRGSGVASPARFSALEKFLGNERLSVLALEVFRLHDQIASNSDGFAIEVIERGLDYASELQHDGLTGYFLLIQGQHLYNAEKNFTEAKNVNLRALELIRRCYEQDSAYGDQLTKALANSAITSAFDGDVAQARALASELTATGSERYLGPLVDILLSPVHFTKDYEATSRTASDYLENGQPIEALEWFIEAEQLALAEHKESELCGLLGDKAVAFRRVGNYNRALETYRRAIELSRKHKDFVNLSRWNQNIAMLLMDTGAEAAAERALKEAISAAEQSGDETQIATVYGNVANLYAKKGNLVQANELLDKAVAHSAADSDLYNTWITNKAYILAALADQLRAERRFDEARRTIESALELFKAETDEQLSTAASMHLMLGEIARASGDATRMVAEIEQAISCYKNAGEPEKAYQLRELLKQV